MQNRCETQCKTIHFRKLIFFVGEKRKSTKGIEKKSGHITTRRVFFLFAKVEKHETGDTKGEKMEREDTKQFEPDRKWNKKNMCSKNKNKRKEKNTKRTK